jgi:hypothetical protein
MEAEEVDHSGAEASVFFSVALRGGLEPPLQVTSVGGYHVGLRVWWPGKHIYTCDGVHLLSIRTYGHHYV